MHSNQYQNKLKDKHDPITIYYAQHFKSKPFKYVEVSVGQFFSFY